MLDEATGLAAFGARVCDASLGRFLSIDPEGFREAAPHSVHRTGHAFDAPTRYADPDGRHPVLLFIYAVPPAATAGVALFNFGSRAVPTALRAIPAALNRVTQLAHHPGTHAAVETAASIATNTPGSISGAASGVGVVGRETVTVQRWMSKAELKATQETGLLRGGRDGTHYVTDAANSDALRAR